MELDINGRIVYVETIFGKKRQILIDYIIKGEYENHAGSPYYKFRIAGDDTNDYLIDYPEEMTYPKTLKQILSGRHIVTPEYIEDIHYNDVRIPYKDILASYKRAKMIESGSTSTAPADTPKDETDKKSE